MLPAYKQRRKAHERAAFIAAVHARVGKPRPAAACGTNEASVGAVGRVQHGQDCALPDGTTTPCNVGAQHADGYVRQGTERLA